MFENERQKRVFSGLLTKVGGAAAAFYVDSCTLRRIDTGLLATRMLVGHTLREVRDGIEKRIAATPNTSSPKSLSIFRKRLHKLAHRRWLELPAPIDEAFLAGAAELDAVLETLLDELTLPEIGDAATSFLEDLNNAQDALADCSLREDDVRILGQFADHVAPGPAAYYHDAIRLMDDRYRFLLTRSHLTAHMLREAESGLRAVLLPHDFVADATKGETTHVQQVEAVLDAYAIPRSDTVAAAWQSIATMASEQNLAARTHGGGLDFARPFDAEARAAYRSVIDVFTAVLARFEHDYGKYVRLMDEMITAPAPRKSDFLSKLPQTDAIYDYFFHRLQDPAWVRELADTNVLRHTPEPRRVGDQIEYPAWPQGDYLRRALALQPELASQIAEILERAGASENPRVHQEITKIAVHLPGDMRRVVAEREAEWIDKTSFTWFLHAEAAGELALSLANDGDTDAAVALLGVVVRFDVVNDDGDEGLRLRTDRLALENILEDVVPPLAAKCGTRVLAVVGDALEVWRGARHPGLVPPVDYSSMWRPAIEDLDEEGHSSDLQDALVDALREGGAAIVAADTSKLREVVTFLVERTWNIARRVALHLAASGDDVVLAAELASRRDLIESEDCWHEMTRLLTSHWSRFPAEVQATIANHIDGKAVESEADRLRQHRLISRLPAPLPAEIAELTLARTREFGRISDPDMLVVPRAGFIEAKSPIPSDELARMEIDEIIAFVLAWKPRPIDFLAMTQDSPAALAEDWRALVAARPGGYAEAADRFRNLPPVYVRAVIGGLADGVERGATFSWERVLELVAWVLAQPRRPNDHRLGTPYDDANWLEVRLAMIDLLDRGMRTHSLPTSAADQVNAFLRELLNDPNPTAEDDRDFATEKVERWAANAIGTVRGRAVSLALVFANWAAASGATEEVFSLIRERLAEDTSAGVRFAVGKVFVHLLALDSNRARDLEPLFDEHAWAGYLQYRVSSDSAATFRQRYARSVAALDANRKPTTVEKWLAQHLALLYAYEYAALAGDADHLLPQFFKRASSALSHHFHSAIAIHLRTQRPEQKVLERLVALWEWRLENGATLQELSAFEDWFRARVFPVGWALDQLQSAAERGARFSGGIFSLTDDLIEVWPQEPRRVMTTVRAIVEGEEDYSRLSASRHGLRQLLELAQMHEDDIVHTEARRIANILTARGLSDFKDFT